MLNFIEVKEGRLLDVLCRLAVDIWSEYYKPLLGDFKAQYMLESMHNKKLIFEEIQKGYKYFILQKNDQHIGYISYANLDFDANLTPESVFINKIYLTKPFRAKGIGRLAFDFIVSHNTQATHLWLLVGKNNIDAFRALNEFGFKLREERRRDIGKGYIIEEYLMVKNLEVALMPAQL